MVDIIIGGKWYKIPTHMWDKYGDVIRGDVEVENGRFSREHVLKAIERVGTLKKVFDKIYNY